MTPTALAPVVDFVLAAAAARIGTTLCGKWKIERLLGVGGMASVFAAPEVVGLWPRTGLFDQHFLKIDRDGAVLLFSSSTLLRGHLIAKLNPKRGDVRLAGLGVRSRSLVQAPVVDEKGYWLLEAGVAPTRLASLGLVGAPWADLGRCF